MTVGLGDGEKEKSSNNWFSFMKLLIILTLIMVQMLDAKVICVDSSAAPGGDGKVWKSAFRDLQDALSKAKPGDEIHMATGTYFPADKNASREASFWIPGGIKIRGGYRRGGSRRDIDKYRVVLSGDIRRDDYLRDGVTCNTENNIYHVIMCEYGDGVELDGITVQGGCAIWNGEEREKVYGTGAGIFVNAWNSGNSACFTIKNCTIQNNSASGDGAGLYFKGSQCHIVSSRFYNNRSGTGRESVNVRGGAVFIESYSAIIDGSDFRGNHSINGGGVMLKGKSFEINSSQFTGNYAYEAGGAICFAGEYLWLTGIKWNENHARGGKGGGLYFRGNSLLIDDLEAQRNSSAGEGGVIYFEGDSCIIRKSAYSENRCGKSGGVLNFLGQILKLDSTSFTSNRAQMSEGGAVTFKGDLCLVTHSLFKENHAPRSNGGAVSFTGKEFRMQKTIYRDNEALAGGALFCNCDAGYRAAARKYPGLVVSTTAFERNKAGSGGAISWMGNGSIEKTKFSSNIAQQGSAICKWVHAVGDTILFRSREMVVDSAFLGAEISASENASITGTVFRRNDAVSGSVIYGWNGKFNSCSIDSRTLDSLLETEK